MSRLNDYDRVNEEAKTGSTGNTFPGINNDSGDNLSHVEILSTARLKPKKSSKVPVMIKNLDGTISIDMDTMREDSGFYVKWKNLSYTVSSNWYQSLWNSFHTTILNGLDGFFLSGELTALMGPSGAGKTTLLNCLCLKNRDGISGEITVVGKPKIRIAVVPQTDEFLPQFTVTETIFYASRYKNRTYDISHRAIVRRVIQQLGLEVCQNNSIIRCSGGQRKRVAIAQELVKKPNILILDEPTSGLDSSSCYQTIEVLRQIIDTASTSTPMSIVTTIHQPSAKVMSLFNRVYMMAPGGRLAFNGSPNEIVPILRKIGAPCPPFYNPIDHMIEVVSGDYGRNKMDRLIKLESSKKIVFNPKLEAVAAQPLKKAVLYDPCPFEDHVKIHIQRSTIQLLRDPILFGLRMSIHLTLPFFFAYLWSFDIGRGKACPSFNMQSLNPISVALSGNLTREEKEDVDLVMDNLAFILYGGMFTMYAAIMITVISFPLEVKVLAREYFNGWYTVSTYLIGKITSDAPFQIFCVLMFTSMSYYISDQPRSDYHWRYIVYAYSLICLSLLSQTQGLIVGAIFMNSLSASVFIGPLTIMPVFLFSGYARRYSRTADYLKPLVKLSYFHYAVRTIYTALYGFGRCKCDPNEYQHDLEDIEYEDVNTMFKKPFSSVSNNVGSIRREEESMKEIYIGQYRCDESFRSLVMKELDVEDTDMYFGLILMTSYLLLLRLLILFLLKFKVKR